MKASTLFILSIALFVGLVVLVILNSFGVFSRRAVAAETKKEEPVLVLVANSDLYKDIAIGASDVRVRELYPEERGMYEQNRGKFMPPFVSAAHLRVPMTPLKADLPLLSSHFVADPPPPVSLRLQKQMRAVNVAVTKERSAGGVIQVGEYADVFLTCKIGDPTDPNKSVLKSACIARECRIIMKRNSLRSVNAADPESAPISFTVEANPYRAALIGFAQYKGQLELVPVKTGKELPLDPRVEENKMPMSFSDMNSAEYRNEDQRIEDMRNGTLPIDDNELIRIFNVHPKTPPKVVERINGIDRAQPIIFGDGRNDPNNPGTTVNPNGGGKPFNGASFQPPNGTGTPECKDCDANKAKAAAANGFTPGGGSPTFSSPK